MNKNTALCNSKSIAQENDSKLSQMKIKEYHCNVCGESIIGSQREDHRREKHSMFLQYKHLFTTIRMVEDELHGLKRKPKNVNRVKCKLCAIKVHQSDFLEHFQQKHPDALSSVGGRKKKKKRNKNRHEVKMVLEDNAGKDDNGTSNNGNANSEMSVDSEVELIVDDIVSITIDEDVDQLKKRLFYRIFR